MSVLLVLPTTLFKMDSVFIAESPTAFHAALLGSVVNVATSALSTTMDLPVFSVTPAALSAQLMESVKLVLAPIKNRMLSVSVKTVTLATV